MTGATQAGRPAAAVITEIRTALENESEFAALPVLGLALRWTADTLRADSMRAPAAAFRAVALADRAFAAAPALFAALELLIERGEPAEQVAADLNRYRERLAALERQTVPLRNHLKALEEAEARMRADIAARDQIGARIAELERIERLAAAVPELRAQRDVLEERAQHIATAVVGAEMELTVAGERLVALTAELMDSLAANTREVLRRTDEQDRLLSERLTDRRSAIERAAGESARLRAELAEATAEATAARERFEHARTDAVTRLAALRRYARADRDVGDALARLSADDEEASRRHAAIPRAMATLQDIEARLAEVDAALGDALTADTQAREQAFSALRAGEPGRSHASAEEE
jgi:chromosome segregation ATPase